MNTKSKTAHETAEDEPPVEEPEEEAHVGIVDEAPDAVKDELVVDERDDGQRGREDARTDNKGQRPEVILILKKAPVDVEDDEDPEKHAAESAKEQRRPLQLTERTRVVKKKTLNKN